MKTIAKLLLAWSAIFVLVFVLLEASFFCCSSFLFPYAARLNLGFGVYPLLQTSKSSTAPAHYTAIFGDSFAFGQGDWFLNVQKQHNPTFNVTHLLHQQTGKDFISFGIPGSSNLTGWTEDPIASLQYINAGWRYTLPEPEHILLYFYEGNDIPDTATDLRERYVINGYDPARLADPDYFAAFINTEMLPKNAIYQQAQSYPAKDNLFFLRYAQVAIEKALDRNGEQKKIDDAIAELLRQRPAYSHNTANMDGKTVYLPDGLQAPPVDMTPDEIDKTLQFLDSIATYVKRRYPSQRISIVYIPSNASSYDITSEFIDVQLNAPDVKYRKEDVIALSNSLCQRMQHIAERHGMDFIDTRPAMLSAGKHALLHGPADTGHLNEAGYRAFAAELLRFLQLSARQSPLVEPCATL